MREIVSADNPPESAEFRAHPREDDVPPFLFYKRKRAQSYKHSAPPGTPETFVEGQHEFSGKPPLE